MYTALLVHGNLILMLACGKCIRSGRFCILHGTNLSCTGADRDQPVDNKHLILGGHWLLMVLSSLLFDMQGGGRHRQWCSSADAP